MSRAEAASYHQEAGPQGSPAPASAPSAPTPGQATEGASGEAAPQAGLGGMMMPFLLIMVVFLVFSFWQSSRQRKKQEQLIGSFKRGDQVFTQSGLVGRLDALEDRFARLEIAPGVKIRVLRATLAGREAAGPESPEKAP